ncbi:MAG: hypothetical protein EOP76_17575 [Variovorax sp.]|nr:MAG: hypothetical protein EOP76_17575 [Variovorax sp.]
MTLFPGSAEIRVHLDAGALIACEVHRQWRKPVVKRKARFEFVPGDRADAMDALAEWIAQAPRKRSIVWIVGSAEAQYFMLPWSPAWVDKSMRDAYARARFEQLYEMDAQQSAFCFAEPSDGSGQMVSCISIKLQAELTAHAERTRCELAGIKPSIAAVWDRFRDVLETEQGTLCVVEGDRQAILRHNRKTIEDIVVKPSGRNAVPASGRGGVFRRFSNNSTAPTNLKLDAQPGFVAQRDAAYAIALCGAL